MTEARGPLAGVRIVDMTAMLAGPWATMILGDQGADVIKIEAPGVGDHTRATDGDTPSPGFLNLNRSKRSVALDLKTPRGRELLLALAKTADVAVQNFRPGVVDRPGRRLRRRMRRATGYRLRFDQRLRHRGSVRSAAGVRPGDPGTFGFDDDPGGIGRGPSPARAHRAARQADGDDGGTGDLVGASCPRAKRPGPAHSPVDAGRGAAVPVGIGHGPTDPPGPRTGAAAASQPDRSDLPHAGRPHHSGREHGQGMGGPRARARQARN